VDAVSFIDARSLHQSKRAEPLLVLGILMRALQRQLFYFFPTGVLPFCVLAMKLFDDEDLNDWGKGGPTPK
jgi:hypothetical protein